VTALRRPAEALEDEAEPMFAPKFSGERPAKTPAPGKTNLSPAEMGAAHHKFLQHVALEKTGELAAEAERQVRARYLTPDERAVLNLEALAEFWNSGLGEKIRANAAKVRRELPFTARFSPAELAEITGRKADANLENEFVVVQGIADLVVLLPQEIWLVDFKTDAVGKDKLPEKIKLYAPQLKLYAAALDKIFSRKATLRALHFLAARRTEMV